VVALLGAAVVLAGARPVGAAPDDARGTVVLLMVTDLTWSTAPPALDGFAKANLSMRAAEAKGVAADAYLSLGKGGRAAGLRGGAGAGRVEALTGGGLRLTDWDELQTRDRELHVSGRLGSTGEALREDNFTWALVSDDEDAAGAAATAEGTVPQAYPGTREGIERAVRAQLDALFVAVPGPELAQALPLLDGLCTLVVSASTPQHSRHLGVLAASAPCGLGAGGLASASTHHAHLATLTDVSRTFVQLVRISGQSAISGGVLAPAAAVGRESLVERDRRTWTADRSRAAFGWLFVALHAIGAAVVVRRPRAGPVVCCGLLAIPAASFLMMLVPWWRGGAWLGLLVGGTVAALIALGGALLARRDLALGVGALAAVTSAVVAVDALFGSPLQIDAPFGNSPVVAGRFFGVGNVGSGLLVAGLLVSGGLALDRWGRRAVPWVVAALAVGIVAGGAPQLGADVGGVLFGVPAYGLLLLGTRERRVRARHVLLLAGAAVLVVVLFAVVDLTLGADSQTHLARSVEGQGMGDDVIRKGGRAIRTVWTPMAGLVVVAVTALAVTRYSPGRRRALRFASYAVVVAAVLGSLLNDSGLNVAGAVLAVAWPAGVAVASQHRVPRPEAEPVVA